MVLSELYHYLELCKDNVERIATKNTLNYLESCNKIFERGFLSHEKVKDENSQVLKNIQDGYKFFTDWSDQIFENGIVKLYSKSVMIIFTIRSKLFT